MGGRKNMDACQILVPCTACFREPHGKSKALSDLLSCLLFGPDIWLLPVVKKSKIRAKPRKIFEKKEASVAIYLRFSEVNFKNFFLRHYATYDFENGHGFLNWTEVYMVKRFHFDAGAFMSFATGRWKPLVITVTG